MDLHRSANIDKSHDFFGGGQSFRPPAESNPASKLSPQNKLPDPIGSIFQAISNNSSDSSGNDAQKALQGLLKRAGNPTSQQVAAQIQKLEEQQRAENSLKMGILVAEREASLNDLTDPEAKQAAAVLTALLERAKIEPPSAFMDCLIAKLTMDLKALAPSVARKQEQIDKLSTSDEAELLKGFKDLPFKGRLSLVLSASDANEAAQQLAEMAAQFSDWELNRQFSRLTPQQAKQLDDILQQARNGIFKSYWDIWNPEVQARAQQLESALRSLIENLPVDRQNEAHQLLSDLCAPKKQNDPVVSKFLLNHISPQLAQKAQQLAELRRPLRAVEKQDKALARIKKHLDLFGPVLTVVSSNSLLNT